MTTNTINSTNARILKAITGRLSLRKPQEDSLVALAQAITSAPDTLEQSRDIESLLKTLSAAFPTL
jgi:type III restriction enzyme